MEIKGEHCCLMRLDDSIHLSLGISVEIRSESVAWKEILTSPVWKSMNLIVLSTDVVMICNGYVEWYLSASQLLPFSARQYDLLRC